MNADRGQVQVGWSAHTRDGHKIGEVEEVGHNYLLVTRGLIVTTELYIPLSAVAAIDPAAGRVHLAVDGREIEGMGWSEPPASADPVAAGAVDGLGYTGRDASGRPEAGGLEQTPEGLGYAGAAVADDDAAPSRTEDSWQDDPRRSAHAVEDEGGGVLAGAAASIDAMGVTSDGHASGVRAARLDTIETDEDDGMPGR